MQASDGANRVLFYCLSNPFATGIAPEMLSVVAGHGILVDGAEEPCNSSLNNFSQAIVAGNGEHIYGSVRCPFTSVDR